MPAYAAYLRRPACPHTRLYEAMPLTNNYAPYQRKAAEEAWGWINMRSIRMLMYALRMLTYADVC